jgi:cytochrome c oxidase subunit 2
MVDNNLVLPTHTFIRCLITGYKVIHSWHIPALGIKADGVPGRLFQIYMWIRREGYYHGGCYELCGAFHHRMPTLVVAVKM